MSAALTDEELDRLEVLLAEATRAPWKTAGASHVYSPGPDGANVCSASEPRATTTVQYTEAELGSLEACANAAAIAATRNAVPALIAEVRAARKAKDELNALCDDRAVSSELIGIRVRNERVHEMSQSSTRKSG